MKRLMKIAFFILVLSLLSGCSNHTPISLRYSGNVQVTLGMGNRNLLAEGKKIPVEVAVSGDYANEAYTVALTVPTNMEDYYCYQKPIQHRGKDTVVFFVPAASQSSQMVAEILNEQDQVIYSRTCSYQFASTEGKDGEIVVGMSGISAENTIWNFASSYDKGYYQIRSVKIQPENLLAVSEAYDSYSMLVLHKDAIAKLTDSQKSAIIDWTGSGRSLLIIGEVSDAREMGFSMKNKRESVKLSQGGLVNGYEWKSGTVWTMSPHLFEWEMDEGEQLNLLEILLNTGISREARYTENRHLLETALIHELEWQGSIGIEADQSIYLVIFGIYLLLGLPGIYLLLRKQDKMHLFRICICGTACFVSLIIWAAGSNTRFSRPFLHSISISSYDQGIETQNIYVSVQAPYNQGYQVMLSSDYDISALQKTENWVGTVSNSYERQTVALKKDNDKICLSFGNMTAFTPQYFELNKENPSELSIEGNIVNGYYGPEGEMTNCMGTDLYQTAILAGEWVVLLDSWADKETIRLQDVIKQQRARVLSTEQFLEGGYRSWEKWGAEYGEIYERILTWESYRSQSHAVVMARRESGIDIQYEQNYQQKEVSLMVTGVELESGH